VAGLGSQIAEDRPRVRVRLLDGRAGEADERRIRQGIAQVAGEAVGHLAGLLIHLAAEPILAAVHLFPNQVKTGIPQGVAVAQEFLVEGCRIAHCGSARVICGGWPAAKQTSKSAFDFVGFLKTTAGKLSAKRWVSSEVISSTACASSFATSES